MKKLLLFLLTMLLVASLASCDPSTGGLDVEAILGALNGQTQGGGNIIGGLEGDNGNTPSDNVGGSDNNVNGDYDNGGNGNNEGNGNSGNGDFLYGICENSANGEHNFTTVTVAPTCQAEGYEQKNCSNCGNSYIFNNIKKLDHEYNSEYSHSDSEHWKGCKACGAKSPKSSGNHEADENNCCKVCGRNRISTEGVIYNINSYDTSRQVRETYAVVVGYEGSAEEVVIANTYMGVPVLAIDAYAFQGTTVTSIDIPDGLEVTENAFIGCNFLTDIKVSENSQTYKAVDGVLYTKDGKTLVCYPLGKNDTEFAIPAGVEKIGNSAFYGNTTLESITMAEGVKNIGDDAFNGCYALGDIAIAESVETIGYQAFRGCSGLTVVIIPDGVTSIGEWAFFNCNNIRILSIGNNVSDIGFRAFYGCSITSLLIPASVENIDAAAFGDCSSLSYIQVGENNGYYKSINGHLYSKDGKTLVKYAPGCSDKEFTVPDVVERIEDYAFSSCYRLESITFGANVTSIGEFAFSWTYFTSITIPDGVTSIGDGAFFGSPRLTSVTIPDSIKSFGTNMFKNCSSMQFTEYKKGQYVGNANNPYLVLVEMTDNTLSTYTIHNDTKVIADRVFESFENLTSIVIPDSVITIGNYSFVWCDNLVSVTIGKNVTSIGENAFDGDGLTSIVIPDSVKTIGYRAFSWCKNAKSITIGSGLTSISPNAFIGCTALLNVEIPDGVKVIEDEAFSWCQSLQSVTLNQGLTSIGNGAFSFSDIRSIVIPDSVTYIGEEAFTWCQSLMFVTLGNGITSIEKGTFSLCQSLASIIIPDGVEVIGDEAFDWCGTLTSVTIPASVTSISETAFLSTPALSHIQVSSDNEFYKSVNGSLYSKDGKTLVKYATGKTASGFTIPEGVEVIGAYAFTDCYNLTSVTLPDSVKEICHDAFSGCSGLEIINIPDGVTSIGDYAFVGCDNLTSIIIPESVTSIGRGVFIRCSSLSNVVIGKGVAFIDNYAFCECENLTEISYCGTEEEFDAIEKELFWKHELTKVVYNYSTEE